MAVTYINGAKIPYAYEKITATTASVGFTDSNIKQSVSTNAPFGVERVANEVLVTVETAAIRATFDGTTPTVTAGTGAGHLFDVGATFVITGYEAISKFRCINAVASSGAVVRATFWRL